MKGLVKFGVVLAGYVAAVLVGYAAVYVRQLNTQGPDAQASAGMYAFGDLLLFVEVFGVVALVPTGLALYFLRSYRALWTTLSIMALGLAAAGLVAALVYVLAASQPPESPWAVWAALAVLPMLGSPLLAAAFALSALIAPRRAPRWALLAAAGIEGVVGVYAFLHWLASFRGI